LRRAAALLVAASLTACAANTETVTPERGTPVAVATSDGVVFPASASQGALVLGKVPAGSLVRYGGRILQPTPYGTVVFGIGRDEAGPVRVDVQRPDGSTEKASIAVTPRDWPIERIDGVPPDTVNPPPEIAARIEREQAAVAAARLRDDDRADFVPPFIWPVQGRVSGRFGNQRVYNGTPKSPHSGMDIAAAEGTPVLAPAPGMVTFANPDLYLTGGTVVLDHGHGVSSNFLHLSRIDVQVGERIAQGQAIGAVGATGRATGPHLHWGMNWFEVRIDPLLVLERKK
jgi:murein DD-endopeptidase MepM/ murein hydrolase activator NlpD